MKESLQLNFIKEQLDLTGKVSRNHCLANNITRLGAYINDLIREGYQFKPYGGKWGKQEATKWGEHDFVYRLENWHILMPPIRSTKDLAIKQLNEQYELRSDLQAVYGEINSRTI